MGIIGPGKPVSALVNANRIGDGGDPNAASTQDVALLVSSKQENPNVTIQQHIVGYSFYTGTPGGGSGSLQGASFQASVYAAPGDVTPAVLGCELIGTGAGENSRTISTVIGGQSTVQVSTPEAGKKVTITNAICFNVSPIKSIGGEPTITTAIGLKVNGPQFGTTRYVTFSKHEVAATIPLHIENTSVEQTANWIECYNGASNTFAITGGGDVAFLGVPRWNSSSNFQETVGPEGTATALPAKPSKYMKIKDNVGGIWVVPAYKVS